MWRFRRLSAWMLPGLVAAALFLSACAQIFKPPPPIDKLDVAGCPGTVTVVQAVAAAMNHADQRGIVYESKTVDVVWLPDAWIMDFQLDPFGTRTVITMTMSMDGRLFYCQGEEAPCFENRPLHNSTCPVPAENWISEDKALRTGRLYLYRQGYIKNAQQPARIKRTDGARWVVFFIGGLEKDRKFTVEVSPGGEVLKFIEGI